MLGELFREYPFLIDSAFVRSRAEAEKMVKAGGLPSCKELVEHAKQNSVLPPEAWTGFDKALEIKSESKI